MIIQYSAKNDTVNIVPDGCWCGIIIPSASIQELIDKLLEVRDVRAVEIEINRQAQEQAANGVNTDWYVKE